MPTLQFCWKETPRSRSNAAWPRCIIPSANLIKVGHHGSNNATTPELVASARPQFAIISVGSGNSFGLPRTEILGRLADAGARVYRTDLDGAVTFYLDGHSVTPSVAALQ
jgi:beta-lactamase superfamily II metal-dependent hydrolase